MRSTCRTRSYEGLHPPQYFTATRFKKPGLPPAYFFARKRAKAPCMNSVAKIVGMKRSAS